MTGQDGGARQLHKTMVQDDSGSEKGKIVMGGQRDAAQGGKIFFSATTIEVGVRGNTILLEGISTKAYLCHGFYVCNPFIDG